MMVQRYKPYTMFQVKNAMFDIVANLSDPFKVFDFNFQAYRPTSSFVESVKTPYTDGTFDYNHFSVEITKEGLIHGGVLWFKVYMDNDGMITLSNSPNTTSSHWGQMLCLFQKDYYLPKGSLLTFEVARLSERYVFAMDEVREEDGDKVTLRIVMVYNTCPDESFLIFSLPEHNNNNNNNNNINDVNPQITPDPDDEVFHLDHADEYNVYVSPVGSILRAVHEASEQYSDYIVLPRSNNNNNGNDDDNNGNSDNDKPQIQIFWIPCPDAMIPSPSFKHEL